jgi:hypothetical protein
LEIDDMDQWGFGRHDSRHEFLDGLAENDSIEISLF